MRQDEYAIAVHEPARGAVHTGQWTTVVDWILVYWAMHRIGVAGGKSPQRKRLDRFWPGSGW